MCRRTSIHTTVLCSKSLLEVVVVFSPSLHFCVKYVRLHQLVSCKHFYYASSAAVSRFARPQQVSELLQLVVPEPTNERKGIWPQLPRERQCDARPTPSPPPPPPGLWIVRCLLLPDRPHCRRSPPSRQDSRTPRAPIRCNAVR